MAIDIPQKFALTRLLLRFWVKFERGQYSGEEVARIVQADIARERHHRIPSLVD
jgi:hypothetical protein